MKLYQEYEREIEIHQSDRGVTFTYYQFGNETFKQDLTEEEASLLASAIQELLGEKPASNPVEKTPTK